MSKYRNKKVNVDGIWFDSIKEARRYGELKLLEKGGYISDLKLQVPYELLPNQKDIDGKVIERKVRYIADFVYRDKNGQEVVEDAKSKATKTEVYRLKKKLMLDKYGIRIKEV